MLKPILVIDDDPFDRMLLTNALRASAGEIDIVEAQDGREGVARVEAAAAPLVVVLDLRMPVFDGWDFLDACLGDEGGDRSARIASVTVLSTSDDQEDLARAKRFGVAAYRLKPDSLDAYGEIADAVVALARAR